MLGENATAEERAVLGAIPYKPNKVYLHRDQRFMPKRKRAWAAWNVLQGKGLSDDLCVTYWMNKLQNLDSDRPVFVTLNPQTPPADESVFGVYTYDHPQFDAAAIEAQPKLGRLQGKNRSWFAGAWTRYGFHEEVLMSRPISEPCRTGRCARVLQRLPNDHKHKSKKPRFRIRPDLVLSRAGHASTHEAGQPSFFLFRLLASY